jgi:hypothetical protein
MFLMVCNQLTRYTEALIDMLTCITSALYTTSYVEPSLTLTELYFIITL